MKEDSKELDPYRFFLQVGEFEEVNVRVAKEQDEFNTLPACFNPKTGAMIFKYELTDEQIEQIKETKCFWFEQYCGNGNFQPVRATAQKSDFEFPPKEVTPQVVIVYGDLAKAENFCRRVSGTHKMKHILYDNQINYLIVSSDWPVVVVHAAKPGMIIEQFLDKHKRDGRMVLVTTEDPLLKIEGAAFVDLNTIS